MTLLASADTIAPGRLDAYVPRGLLRFLATTPDERFQAIPGTMLFLDLSGFTKLSERLQRVGREGAELMADAVNGCFHELLGVSHANGGSLIKFGGDALLLFFEGELHPERACRAGFEMRRLLRTVGRLRAGSARVNLRMTVGIHSDTYYFFLAGESHREYLVAGPAATAIVDTEGAAETGQIVISRATAAQLPERCLGEPAGDGLLLARSPIDFDHAPPVVAYRPSDAAVAASLSTAVRAHVTGEPTQPEHRNATIAFLHYSGTDAILRDEGPDACAAALHELMRDAQRAADDWDVCFLGTDLDANGGKVILTAGAPRVVGDDEARILLACRQIIEGDRRLAVHIGVNRGPAFTGDIGPPYRRTYTMMGDTINLAARLMAKAPVGEIYATAGVLERSTTRFATRPLEPFMAKGKARPIEAWSVGSPQRGAGESARRSSAALPLVGRVAEIEAIDAAIAASIEGHGRLLEIVGHAGIGKTRLVDEIARRAPPVQVVRVACEAYTSLVPYAVWHGVLRELLSHRDERPEAMLARLRDRVRVVEPALEPWMPLVAMALDVPSPSSPEVDALADDARRPKLHEALLRLLHPLRHRGLRIEIEDAHVMDEASAAFLAALVEALPGAPWLIVVTRRDVVGGFSSEPAKQVVRLVPEPLSSADARTLAEAATDLEPLPPHLVAMAVERSDGSPRFLLDLLDAIARGEQALPESAEAAAMARIDALPVADRTFVRRTSVLGLSFRESDLAGVLDAAGQAPDERRWERLAAILDRTPDGSVRFRHANLREAAYGSLPFGMRRRLHGAVATMLEQDRAEAADPATLSLHFTLAGDYKRGYELALAAARRALERAAAADAARLYRRALEAGRLHGVSREELADAWEALAAVLQRLGEPTGAQAALSAARALVRGDPLRESELLCLHAQTAASIGHLTQSVRWARRGLRTLDGLDGASVTSRRADLLVALATARQDQGHSTEAITLCRQAIADAESCSAEMVLAAACMTLDLALWLSGSRSDTSHSRRALEIYERLGEIQLAAVVRNNLGGFAYFAGDWDAAVRHYEEAGEQAARAGDVRGALFADCNTGEVLSDQGRYEAAEPRLRAALRLSRATANDEIEALARTMLGRLQVRLGREGEGVELLRRAHQQQLALGRRGDAQHTEELIAEGLLAGGDPRGALELLDRPRAADAQDSALALRVRAIALEAEGSAAHDVVAALAIALTTARDDEDAYETALALSALCARPDGSTETRRRELADLVTRLGVERLPAV